MKSPRVSSRWEVGWPADAGVAAGRGWQRMPSASGVRVQGFLGLGLWGGSHSRRRWSNSRRWWERQRRVEAAPCFARAVRWESPSGQGRWQGEKTRLGRVGKGPMAGGGGGRWQRGGRRIEEEQTHWALFDVGEVR